MRKPVARVLAVIAIGIALWVYLRYFGDFSWNQSTALTLIACAALAIFLEFRYGHKKGQSGDFVPFHVEVQANRNALSSIAPPEVSQRQSGDFVPFHVEVHPEWGALLKDFGLATNDEEVNRLREESARTAAPDYDLMRYGFAFTVLQTQSDAPLPGLTFLDNRKVFVNDLDLRHAIRGIRIDGGFPELYFRASSDPNPMHDVPDSRVDWKNCKPELVWELGLIVPERWWKKACDADSTRRQVLTETEIGGPPPPANKRLIVARLPYSEFDIYFRPNVHFHDGLPDMAEFKRRREKLSARGWEWDQDEIPDEDGGTRVKHKYFIVSHEYLDKRGSRGA